MRVLENIHRIVATPGKPHIYRLGGQWCIAAHASDKSDMLLAHWKKFVEWKKRLRRGEVNA
jgi:hypothetical protein